MKKISLKIGVIVALIIFIVLPIVQVINPDLANDSFAASSSYYTYDNEDVYSKYGLDRNQYVATEITSERLYAYEITYSGNYYIRFLPDWNSSYCKVGGTLYGKMGTVGVYLHVDTMARNNPRTYNGSYGRTVSGKASYKFTTGYGKSQPNYSVIVYNYDSTSVSSYNYQVCNFYPSYKVISTKKYWSITRKSGTIPKAGSGSNSESDGRRRLVRDLYQRVLKRTASEAEVNSHCSKSAGQICSDIILSPEANSKNNLSNLSNAEFVKCLYRFLLNREYDAGGLNAHTQYLNAGYNRESLIKTFANSQEFHNIYG